MKHPLKTIIATAAIVAAPSLLKLRSAAMAFRSTLEANDLSSYLIL
jgi:hypothetical protein